jgi:hypothetical protein
MTAGCSFRMILAMIVLRLHLLVRHTADLAG